jgi:bifunctional DNA-binding transcriptional regulator/antitoxin component of YhaV-PrlF toxin-antitoxin module
MTVAVKNNNKTPLVVPPAVRRRAGFKSGQELEIKASAGVITILPKLPTADDEYTPAQRRVIDARLAEGLTDIKAGRTFGPFNNADEMITHMKSRLKKKATTKKAARSR